MAETFEIFTAAKSDVDRYFETCKLSLREDYVELIRGEGAEVELDDQRKIGNPLPSRVQFQGALNGLSLLRGGISVRVLMIQGSTRSSSRCPYPGKVRWLSM
jgi:hypothetical protein